MSSLETLYTGEPAEAQHLLNNFWSMVTDEIKNVHVVSTLCLCYVSHLHAQSQNYGVIGPVTK